VERPHQVVGLGSQDGTGLDLFACRISPFGQELTVEGVPLIINNELTGLPGERTILDRFPLRITPFRASGFSMVSLLSARIYEVRRAAGWRQE
jgi:hypothetical protein